MRILVDGYSLLHHWLEIAPGKPRYSGAAREELVHWLRHYGDATGTPITVVFDGAGPRTSADAETPSTREMEILYTKTGQTADDVIERATPRLAAYGEVLVVTDDFAERETVASSGGSTMSCAHFARLVTSTVGELARELKRHNLSELKNYRKAR